MTSEECRSLDAEVAERVMGWRWVTNDHQAQGWATDSEHSSDPFALVTDLNRWHGWVWPLTPEFSSDIAAAFVVVEKMRAEWSVTIRNDIGGWQCSFGTVGRAFGETAPLAICRAALLAVSQNQPQASNSPDASGVEVKR